jgi:hypothetical protein
MNREAARMGRDDADDVDGMHATERDRVIGVDRGGCKDAGVRDQNIEPSEVPVDVGDKRRHLRRIGLIGLEGLCPNGLPFHVGHNGHGPISACGETDRYVRAELGKRQRRSRSDPARTACHKRNLAGSASFCHTVL